MSKLAKLFITLFAVFFVLLSIASETGKVVAGFNFCTPQQFTIDSSKGYNSSGYDTSVTISMLDSKNKQIVQNDRTLKITIYKLTDDYNPINLTTRAKVTSGEAIFQLGKLQPGIYSFDLFVEGNTEDDLNGLVCQPGWGTFQVPNVEQGGSSPTIKDKDSVCTLTYTPFPILIPSYNFDTLPGGYKITFSVTVNSPNLPPDTKFDLYFAYKNLLGSGQVAISDLKPSTNPKTIGLLLDNKSQLPVITINGGSKDKFQVGMHQIDVKRQGVKGNFCELPFEIKSINTSQQVSCNIETINPTNESTKVKLNGKIDPPDKYRFSIPVISKNSSNFQPETDSSFKEIDIGFLNAGTYNIVLQRDITSNNSNPVWEETNCQFPITVMHTKDLLTPGPPTTITINPQGPEDLKAKVCKTGDKDCSTAGGIPCEDDTNPGMKTAIGCIHTNPVELVKDFLKFALGISGGIAFLLMLFGAFQMLTSAGNPETLNAGKERLTSALIGLLLIIFSVLLLQIIGVDILGLPGFDR